MKISISSTNVNNLKATLLIALKEREAITSSELTFLDNMMNECPSEGNLAKYLASGINAELHIEVPSSYKLSCVSSAPRNFKEISNGELREMELYPNPSMDRINIKSNSETTVTIYDSMRKEVLGLRLEVGTNTFDISTLEKGVYFITPNNDTNNIIKFIKL